MKEKLINLIIKIMKEKKILEMDGSNLDKEVELVNCFCNMDNNEDVINNYNELDKICLGLNDEEKEDLLDDCLEEVIEEYIYK